MKGKIPNTMRYFLDTEFLEGKQTIRQLGLEIDTWLRIFGVLVLASGIALSFIFDLGYVFSIPNYLIAGFLISLTLSKTPNTIDLISIGIVSEDDREYYAISKDFNLKEAWNRYQLEDDNSVGVRIGVLPKKKKVYWIRENVLKPIFEELHNKSVDDKAFIVKHPYSVGLGFSYNNLKTLINWYGLTNKQIEAGVIRFTLDPTGKGYAKWLGGFDDYIDALKNNSIEQPVFYGYYADYDWVVFCWLFGKMIDLPKNFPMYARDLQQMQDFYEYRMNMNKPKYTDLYVIKEQHGYPSQDNKHNALSDAKWNKELYDFLDK